MDKTQEFIQKAILVHGNKYDYSKVIYVNNRTKIIIGCKHHDEIKELGYNLVVMWESDWNKINKSISILQKKFRNYI